MAVLNKIRQRSVFLILIIGLALFAFILSSLLKNGGMSSQKSRNTIATVNGKDVDRVAFARQVEAYQRNARGNSSTMQAVDRVWNQQLRQVIIQQQMEELGISAEEAQIRQMIKIQMANNPNFTNEAGVFDENKLKEYVANLKATSPQAYQQWLQFEDNMGASAAQNIYYNMVNAGIGATLTEGEQAYKLENNTMDLKFVQIPFTSIPDDKVEISKSDIKSYIKDHPAKFESKKSRNMQFVYFEEQASQEDNQAIKEELSKLLKNRVAYNEITKNNDTLPGFNKTSNNAEFVNTNSDIPYQERFVFEKDLPKSYASQIFNLQPGETFGPYKENNYWKLSKLVETKQIPDSVQASHILLVYQGSRMANEETTRTKDEAKKLADSLAGVVKSDASKFGVLAKQFSDDPSAQQNGGDLGEFTPGTMIPEFEDFVFQNKKGDVGVVETDLGYHVIEINKQTEKEKAVKLATVAREVQPSEKSMNKLFNEVTKFEIAAGEGDFEEEAKKDNYKIRTVRELKPLDENIPGVGQQRRIVQWAFEDETNTGDVKRFDTPNGYVVARLTAKHKAGLMSPEDASATVTPILMKERKAKLIKEKLNGGSLQEIANSQNRTVQTASAVSMSKPVLPGAGREPKVVGAVFALKEGKTSKPITGDKGVYVVELTGKSNAPDLNSYNGIAQQQTMLRRREASTRVFDALEEKADIEDKRAKFY